MANGSGGDGHTNVPRLVAVVAAHHAHVKRSSKRVDARLDRLTSAVTKGRTHDAQHLTKLRRRVNARARRLER